MSVSNDFEHVVRPLGEMQVGALDDEEDEGGGEDDNKENKDGVQAGFRAPVKMLDPLKPSDREVEQHELTHLPYRNWCWKCVFGRGKEMPHKQDKTEKVMQEIHFDFMLLEPKDEGGETIPVIVVRETLTKMTMAAAAPRKSSGTHIARRVMAFLEEIGCVHCDVVVKSDQEPAIMSVVKEVGRLRAAAGGGKYIIENSPVRSSASNGKIERAIQALQAQTRVLKVALEDRWKLKLPHRHAVVPWMIEYSAVLLNRFEVSNDGRTAYERLKAKPAKTLGMEFGEAIQWRTKPATGPLGKLESAWDHGVYLGLRGKSGEITVGSKSGVWRTRTVRRKPVDERWSPKSVEMVTGVPWRTNENDQEMDGEKYEVIKLEDTLRMKDEEAERERRVWQQRLFHEVS